MMAFILCIINSLRCVSLLSAIDFYFSNHALKYLDLIMRTYNRTNLNGLDFD